MKIRITAIRKASYPDLMAKYENPIEHTCDVLEGQEWISIDGRCPEGMEYLLCFQKSIKLIAICAQASASARA